MQTAITQGIRVSVESFYQPAYSKPLAGEFVHAYRVTIENLTGETVQLMRRCWQIWDSNGIWREVEGEGVVGQQPILEPLQQHQYVSGCPLRTEIGKMYGHFTMQRLSDSGTFDVTIPVFELVAPFKYN